MNTPTMTMPAPEARRRLKEYRSAIHRKADAEYVQLEKAYQQLAAGRPLLSLPDAFALAPLDLKGRPRLAIARADERQVRFTWNNWVRAAVFNSRWSPGQRAARDTIQNVAMPQMPSVQVPAGYALVPLVPPNVKRHHALDQCHVLWEVEQWANEPIRAVADRDPYLLRWIGGDLWAVLGEWELTDVERAVMAGRRQ